MLQQQTYGGTMGNNATGNMMTRLTKRLMINNGGSGSKLEFYLSNSILLVVRDSTPDCHAIFAMLQKLHAISAMPLRLHAIACNVAVISAKKKLMSTTVRVLENTSGTRSGTESLPKVFLHDNCEQIYIIIFLPFSKKRNKKRDSFYTANVFLPDCF
jgi:hypothetical protein